MKIHWLITKKAEALYLNYGNRYSEELSKLENNIGTVLKCMERYEDSKEYLERSLQRKLEMFGEKNPSVGVSLHNLGDLQKALGNYEIALKYYDDAYRIKVKTQGAEHSNTMATLVAMGLINTELAKFKLSMSQYRKCLEIQKTKGEQAIVHFGVGEVAAKLKDYKSAILSTLKSRRLYKDIHGENHYMTENLSKKVEEIEKNSAICSRNID